MAKPGKDLPKTAGRAGMTAVEVSRLHRKQIEKAILIGV